jgi:transcriptional regulator with XRE-family HTH domain
MRQRPRARRGEGGNPWTLQNGYAMREFRELMGLSGSSVASAAGISHSALCNYEAERRSAPEDVLGRIAEEIGVSAEALRREKSAAAFKGAQAPEAITAEAVA